jgi:UDP-N-acetylmuramoyl-L-alanyl-D-glutamate--2,6-diaminopimelate ligase
MNAALATRPLAALLEGLTDAAVPSLGVTDVALDSRAVTPGALFLAVRGYGSHGLAHAKAAIARGAVAVAWEPAEGVEAPLFEVPTIAVDRLGRHAGEIAARFFRQPATSMFTVGITGTDGKTSTAHLLAQAFDRLDVPCAYFGTIGYGRLGVLQEASHTTPDAVRVQALLAAQRDDGVKACAMEVSSHALHQSRVGGITFDVAVLTNVGRDHLDYHGTVEAYAEAKRQLFDRAWSKTVVLNRDDVFGAAWAQTLTANAADRVVIYGLGGDVPVAGRFIIGRELSLHGAGLRLMLQTCWGDALLESPLFGRFNAYNLMAALGALLLQGTPLSWAVEAVGRAMTVPGRIEAFRSADPSKPLVVVDYAHTPQALENVLDAVRAHCAGRLICVFGAGGDRDRGKRPLMGAAAAARADIAIVTDDNPRSEDPAAIVAAIVEGASRLTLHASRLTVIHDRATAIAHAIGLAKPEDIVVIAGKGHETTQTYGREVRVFSDRAYVAQRLGLEPRS